jgi:hypothetical protein
MQKYIKYLAAFFLLLVLFDIIGIIKINLIEVTSFVLLLSGFILFYTSFGDKKKIHTLIGSSLFLIGILIDILSYWDIEFNFKILYTSFFFISAVGMLLLFFEETKQKLYLYFSLLFFLLSFIIILLTGSINTGQFPLAFWDVFKEFWLIIVVIIVALIGFLSERNS